MASEQLRSGHLPPADRPFSPVGQLLAAADVTGSGGLTYLWNAATGQKVATLRDPGGRSVNAVAFSPNGKLLATGDSNGSVYEFDTGTDLASTGLTSIPGQVIELRFPLAW